mmetsp:Transcript_19180/g.52946  ORF Transcript_19180/g.52946 Transcript_19180/m.52946 type:complete len:405 (-) Transcript_19180:551-1765(-)
MNAASKSPYTAVQLPRSRGALGSSQAVLLLQHLQDGPLVHHEVPARHVRRVANPRRRPAPTLGGSVHPVPQLPLAHGHDGGEPPARVGVSLRHHLQRGVNGFQGPRGGDDGGGSPPPHELELLVHCRDTLVRGNQCHGGERNDFVNLRKMLIRRWIPSQVWRFRPDATGGVPEGQLPLPHGETVKSFCRVRRSCLRGWRQSPPRRALPSGVGVAASRAIQATRLQQVSSTSPGFPRLRTPLKELQRRRMQAEILVQVVFLIGDVQREVLHGEEALHGLHLVQVHVRRHPPQRVRPLVRVPRHEEVECVLLVDMPGTPEEAVLPRDARRYAGRRVHAPTGAGVPPRHAPFEVAVEVEVFAQCVHERGRAAASLTPYPNSANEGGFGDVWDVCDLLQVERFCVNRI